MFGNGTTELSFKLWVKKHKSELIILHTSNLMNAVEGKFMWIVFYLHKKKEESDFFL